MCGVIGVYSKTQVVDSACIERALPVLAHRGPDERNIWISENRQVGLGHTRLSIIGLQNGRQPLASEDKKIHAVVNGEFYGFEAIREDLKSKGHSFSTDSDSEILIHLYEEMGTACLHRLRGEFAGILWDEKNKTFFAARDRFGIKPLFYTQVRGQIFVASEVKALLAMGVDAKWDLEAQFQIHAGVTLPNRTLFEGIYSIPPGHFLIASRGDLKIIPYWDFNYPKLSRQNSPPDSVPSFEKSVKLIRAKLQEAILIRMRADVPIGVYLSGGIDSCAILGFASQMVSRPLHAFTLSFDDTKYDERAIAQEMAKHSGAEFCPIEITSQDLADNFESAVVAGETLLTNGHAIAKYLLSRAVNHAGFKVVLTGEGADEVFGGYAPFKRDMILYNSKNSAAEISSLIQELQKTNAVSSGTLFAPEAGPVSLSLVQALGFMPSHLEAFLLAGSKLRSLLNPDFLSDFIDRDPVRILLNELDVRDQLHGREPLHQSMYLWSKTTLPQYLLTVLGDRMEMSHSVEGRVPFLDHELVEALVRLPASYKINGLTEKYILREAARPVLTETVYRRQKHPFFAPPASVQTGNPFYQFIQDTLRSSDGLSNIPFYAQKEVLKLLDTVPNLSAEVRLTVDPLFMMMASCVILQKRYKI